MTQTVEQIGHSFLNEYYTSMAEAPSSLVSMYGNDAFMATPEAEFNGKEEITEHIKSTQAGRKYRIHKVGAYESLNNSLVVIAKGTMLTPNNSMLFNHTFVLSKVNDKRYCIRNDIQVEFHTAAPPAPAPVVEEVAPTPVVEEVVPEPEPEPEVEPEPEPEPEPTPTPAPKARSPAAQPAKPVKEEVVEEEEIKVTDWASRARKAAKTEVAASSAKQVLKGGTVPGVVPAQAKEEEKPKRRSERKEQFSIYVSMGTSNFKDSDIDALFKKYGKIVGKTLKAEKQFAFVDFETKKAAEAAIDAASQGEGIKFNGTAVKCHVTKDNKDKDGKKPAPKKDAAPARRK